MNQEDVSLLQMLDGVVELLDDRRPVNAGELLLLLTDDVVQDLVRTLQGDFNPAFVVLGQVGWRPQRQNRVVDEGLMFPWKS